MAEFEQTPRARSADGTTAQVDDATGASNDGPTANRRFDSSDGGPLELTQADLASMAEVFQILLGWDREARGQRDEIRTADEPAQAR